MSRAARGQHGLPSQAAGFVGRVWCWSVSLTLLQADGCAGRARAIVDWVGAAAAYTYRWAAKGKHEYTFETIKTSGYTIHERNAL